MDLPSLYQQLKKKINEKFMIKIPTWKFLRLQMGIEQLLTFRGNVWLELIIFVKQMFFTYNALETDPIDSHIGW